MKIFLSSTFLDLAKETAKAVLEALRRKRASTLAMEDFLATHERGGRPCRQCSAKEEDKEKAVYFCITEWINLRSTGFD